MWKCRSCNKENQDSVNLCDCGFDNSKDYVNYHLLSCLTKEEKTEWEQRQLVNKIGTDWVSWAESVRKEFNSLDETDAQWLLEEVKNHYLYSLQRIRERVSIVFTFIIGTEAFSGSCDEEISDKWKRFATGKNDGPELTIEGNLWYFGVDRHRDYRKAVVCYRTAEEMNDFNAINNLGNCYLYGKGVLKNEKKAVEYYKRAAEGRNPEGQYNLGCCCQYGKGIERDLSAAFSWYQKAANAGLREAQRKLADLYFEQGEHDIAMKWYKRASNAGDREAQRILGYCYRYGKGVKINKEEAVKWYEKAALQGDVISQQIMGDLYNSGEGVRKDPDEAKKWYQMSSKK